MTVIKADYNPSGEPQKASRGLPSNRRVLRLTRMFLAESETGGYLHKDRNGRNLSDFPGFLFFQQEVRLTSSKFLNAQGSASNSYFKMYYIVHERRMR